MDHRLYRERLSRRTTVSSSLARKEVERSSMNLYSMFWMKSRWALPPLCITRTARCWCGSLMHVFSMRIRTWAVHAWVHGGGAGTARQLAPEHQRASSGRRFDVSWVRGHHMNRKRGSG